MNIFKNFKTWYYLVVLNKQLNRVLENWRNGQIFRKIFNRWENDGKNGGWEEILSFKKCCKEILQINTSSMLGRYGV